MAINNRYKDTNMLVVLNLFETAEVNIQKNRITKAKIKHKAR
jgi:hypothetical protein